MDYTNVGKKEYIFTLQKGER